MILLVHHKTIDMWYVTTSELIDMWDDHDLLSELTDNTLALLKKYGKKILLDEYAAVIREQDAWLWAYIKLLQSVDKLDIASLRKIAHASNRKKKKRSFVITAPVDAQASIRSHLWEESEITTHDDDTTVYIEWWGDAYKRSLDRDLRGLLFG